MARACLAVLCGMLTVGGGQIIFGGGLSPQLVHYCGRAQPSGVVFPFRQFSRRRRGAGRLQVAGLDGMRFEKAVVGGDPVQQERGRWPWMVLLGERRDGRRVWTCGGTLISARTVLTAAHCVVGRQPSQLTARLGEHDVSTTRDGQHVDASVSSIVIHPNYSNKQNDIALLHLSRPMRFSRRVQPACLPPANLEIEGESVDLAGWGYTEFNGEVPLVLQEVKLQVVGDQKCEQAYSSLVNFQRDFPGGFQGTKLCASGANGTSKDACKGDSGGPLVYLGPGRDARYQVVGVVSTGLGCGNPLFPGINTKVSKYISWIFANSA